MLIYYTDKNQIIQVVLYRLWGLLLNGIVNQLNYKQLHTKVYGIFFPAYYIISIILNQNESKLLNYRFSRQLQW